MGSKELYEVYKGRLAIVHDLTGVVCGYLVDEFISEALVMVVIDDDYNNGLVPTHSPEFYLDDPDLEKWYCIVFAEGVQDQTYVPVPKYNHHTRRLPKFSKINFS